MERYSNLLVICLNNKIYKVSRLFFITSTESGVNFLPIITDVMVDGISDVITTEEILLSFNYNFTHQRNRR